MLEISRPDIDCDEITNLTVADRFIKLPIVPYLKLLNVYDTINRPQIALINAVNSPKYRFIVAALARRLGKTYISNIIAQLILLVPSCNVLIMSPNFALSSISFDLQRKLIRHFDLEVTKDNLKDKILTLANESEVRMGALRTVDSTVGRSYDLIIFDEAALGADGEEAFNVSLRPTLDKPNSKAIFISTPRGKMNWFSKFYQRGYDPNYPEWCSIKADWTENSRMLVSDVEEAKRSMTTAEFEQEYMANFSVYEGQIFQVKENNIGEYEPGDGDECIAGLDPGYKDPTAFIVIKYKPTEDCFYIVDEYLESEAKTPEHAARFKELEAKWAIEAIFIDSAAPQFANDLAYIYDVSTINAKKDVLPGIAYVQALLETGRLKISRECVQTLAAFDQYQWDDKEGLQREKPKHPFSHIPDGVRYALYTYTL
jgi:hypothetical protein